MGSNPIRLKGLFDRPISSPIDTSHPLVQRAMAVDANTDEPFDPYPVDCPAGYLPNAFGGCDQDPYAASNPLPIGNPFQDTTTQTGNSPTQIVQIPSSPSEVTINNQIAITDSGIQAINDSITSAINNTNAQTQKVIDELNKAIVSNIQEESDSIQASIKNASTNLGDEVKITTAALAGTTAATVATTAKSINDEISAVKNAITPILTSITGFIDQINAEVQSINDTFIRPIVNLYNTTIGTISTLTQAIETDLHEGIAGLLKIPGQLADQLGSFDATLDRTVQQLGIINKQTVTDGITFFSQSVPEPLSKALGQSLTGKTVANSLTTTFGDKVELTNESLGKVSTEAISGLSGLLKQLLGIVSDTFKGTLSDMHANWASVESMFTGLLDGALSLLTTLTAIASLAAPLIEAAEQESNKLIPVTKLDPGTVIAALRRGFIDTQTALAELATKGLDATRSQVLIDMSVFLADANMALDWWYRGLITEADLVDNLQKHGLQTEDITAYREASINLPTMNDLTRWLNFRIITQDQFVANAKALRYNDAQLDAILQTYRERETPQTLSALNGLLNNSSAGFINATMNQSVPDIVATAGERAGYHPDLVRYIWLAHWQIPSVDAFIESYFRGFRTQTEVKQRMSIANIPAELQDELIEIKRPLLPLRMIPSAYSRGLITQQQAETELRSHGHNEAHIQLILQAYAPAKPATANPVASTLHGLSVSNAKQLWADSAITTDQYKQILEAHGYDSQTADLQIQVDSVNQHIHAQKAELSDLTSQVLAGVLSIDDATIKLNTDGFTPSQIAKFQSTIAKQLKLNTKIPSIADLNKFLKAQLITLDQYTNALQMLGWQEPWLSAYLGLVSSDGVAATETSGATQ